MANMSQTQEFSKKQVMFKSPSTKKKKSRSLLLQLMTSVGRKTMFASKLCVAPIFGVIVPSIY
jgi:hypothetical protein